MSYDITDATQSAVQESRPTIDWANICGQPHEYTDDNGLGVVFYDRGEYGEGARACDNCIEIRDDYRNWLLVGGYKVPAR